MHSVEVLRLSGPIYNHSNRFVVFIGFTFYTQFLEMELLGLLLSSVFFRFVNFIFDPYKLVINVCMLLCSQRLSLKESEDKAMLVTLQWMTSGLMTVLVHQKVIAHFSAVIFSLLREVKIKTKQKSQHSFVTN